MNYMPIEDAIKRFSPFPFYLSPESPMRMAAERLLTGVTMIRKRARDIVMAPRLNPRNKFPKHPTKAHPMSIT